jgi:hypothetical protein
MLKIIPLKIFKIDRLIILATKSFLSKYQNYQKCF